MPGAQTSRIREGSFVLSASIVFPPTREDRAVTDLESFHVYDTSLRDGAQQEGLSLSVHDKLAIAGHLDELGVGFVEGGWPGAVPKDTEFFRRARTELNLKTATLAAFGATRKAGARAADDPQVRALLDAETPVVTLVAKSHVGHVERALRTTLDENLAMIADTVAYLTEHGRRVFVDCEHFFDGYRTDPAYALRVVRAATEAGADVAVLCDTNGGMLPDDVRAVVAAVAAETGARLGMHAHNDTGCAVANTVAAVDAGATHVQGTVNGTGERTGNADIVTIVANLELKRALRVLPDGALQEATRIAHAVSELTNIVPYSRQPYVGASAFAHKAGLHASAIKVDPDLYQHTDPELVGNDMRLLVSDMAGRASIELKSRELGYDVSGDRELVTRVTQRVKDLEAAGYTFEAADASFELLLRTEAEGQRLSYFDVESWRVITESRPGGDALSEATVKLRAGGERVVVTGEGNGPVNALDHALRTAIGALYPEIDKLELIDFRVRILDAAHGTDAVTRVLVEMTDGKTSWETVGVGANIIEASWEALVDAVTYGLLRQGAAAIS
ncbi:citramalate synthase [Jiangella asiatica]|uniref:Citramalate synthase n=1 Tax=Jiangella asiatica TaxID=2530372 RepID=A0A4R5DGT6_9ACTN|nr:citramalate synthase [Jiangella asiatica]